MPVPKTKTSQSSQCGEPGYESTNASVIAFSFQGLPLQACSCDQTPWVGLHGRLGMGMLPSPALTWLWPAAVLGRAAGLRLLAQKQGSCLSSSSGLGTTPSDMPSRPLLGVKTGHFSAMAHCFSGTVTTSTRTSETCTSICEAWATLWRSLAPPSHASMPHSTVSRGGVLAGPSCVLSPMCVKCLKMNHGGQ